MKPLDIGQVSRRSGLPASTLRFYEEKGLITSIGRRGLRRSFDGRVLERLALIALGQASGFSLDEIAQMFGPDGKPRIDRASLRAKAAELERTIERLTAMRDGLRHAAVCTAPSHMECPKFRRLMRLAGEGRLNAPVPRAAPARRRSASVSDQAADRRRRARPAFRSYAR